MKKALTPKKSSEEPEIDEEERELFLNAFFQNISLRDKITHNEKLPPSEKKAPIDESDRELFLRAVNQGDFFSRLETPTSKTPTRKTPLSQKRDNIDAHIDLHGLFAEEAVNRLLRFIANEKARGSRVLLVVHGKGSGVLKNAVWSIAETNAAVDDFQVAPGKHGGEGAIIMRINRKYRR
jgi:DNA-nicking Smr family endonuclease